MFMTGESTGALKPYLLIEDKTGKEYSILLAMRTGHYVGGKALSLNLRHTDKTSHNKPGVFSLNNLILANQTQRDIVYLQETIAEYHFLF